MFRINKPVDFSKYGLIIPSVSVGNVGQLTCDLIIENLKFTKIGSVWHKAIIPVYGSNAFDSKSDDNSVACEIFESEENKIILLQIRSRIEPKMVNMFLDDLKSNIVEKKFTRVLIISSSFSYEMHDIQSAVFRFATNCAATGTTFTENQVEPFDNPDELIVHGSGFAIKLFEKLKDFIPTSTIIKYSSEGDNRADAISMLLRISKCFKLKPKLEKDDIIFPESWKMLFGNPPPTGIF